MKQSFLHPTQTVQATVVCVAAIWVAATVTLQAAEIHVGRYSVLTATTHEQVDPLATMTTQFSDQIQTVGDAVRDLSKRNDYRLITIESIEPETAGLLALPLPAADRRLGPVGLRQALQTLAGASFRLILDPVTRVVAFDRSENDINGCEHACPDE